VSNVKISDSDATRLADLGSDMEPDHLARATLHVSMALNNAASPHFIELMPWSLKFLLQRGVIKEELK
jgi:hypothetical protein